MSQVNTQQMGRMVAAGNKEQLGGAVDILAHLEALHIIDYDGTEDGFTLGSPEDGSEEVGRCDGADKASSCRAGKRFSWR